MAHISKEEVLKIAYMSRIAIHDDEIDALVKKLSAVLSYAQRVKDLADVHEITVQNSNIFREDTTIATPAQPLLRNAPQQQEHYYVVPAILET